MNTADRLSLETRVLVLAPTANDGALTREMLTSAGITCIGCGDAAQVCAELAAGAGAVMIAEEAVHGSDGCLAEWIGQQPVWSDMPVLVLARAGADSPDVAWAMNALGNVTVVERPARVAAVVSAVRSALRARRRQYEWRDELVQRAQYAEQLHMAMAAAHAGSWQLNATTGQFTASDRAVELHGLSAGTALTHEGAMACVHPDDRASIEEALRVTLESGAAFFHEHRVLLADGSVRCVASHAVRRIDAGQICLIGHVQDVTTRNTGEAQLRASEERFRRAADAVNGIIYEWDVQTGHVERTRGLYEILGYRASNVPPTATWWREQMHPDDQAAGEKALASLSGDFAVSEYRVRHEAGHWIHVEDRAMFVRDISGAVLHVIGCTTDVTPRKRAEAAQQAALRQLAATLESTTDAFTRFDPDWRVVYLNDAAVRMYQRPRSETAGQILWELFPALLGTSLEAEYRRCVAEQVTVDFDFHDKPRGFWFSVKCFPTPEGGLVVSLRDITDRKRSDDARRRSEARFRAGIEAVSDIVWTTDATGMMTGEQVAWETFTGQDSERYAGHGWLSLVHPDEAQPTLDAWSQAVAEKKNFTFEHRVRRRDGQWRICRVRAVPVLNEQGDVSDWVGVHTDITELKQVERALAERTEMLNGVLEGTTDVIFVKDLDGRIVLVNAAFAAAAGSTPEQLLGKTDEDLFPPDVATVLRHADEALLADGSPVQIEETIPVAGEPRVFLTMKAPLRDGSSRVIGILGIGRDITDRVEAEAALRTSEARFRTLFESMDEGFCVIEMAFEEGGRARDYRVLEKNPAFGQHTGMTGLVGRSVREAIPDLEEFWYETYGRVAATGEPIRFVRETAIGGGRWLDVYAFRLGAAGSNKVAILFSDITLSRHAEETVRASDARNSFLMTLGDTLRPLSDPIKIQVEASRVLGERLGANRVAYYEVHGDDCIVQRDYTNTAPSIVGCHSVASFGREVLAVLQAGRIATAADVDALPLTADERAVYASLQIRAYIGVPLIKDGQFVAGLSVHADTVRQWTPAEIAIAEDTAERTWAAVERARAENALRESEAQRRLALEAAELGTWHVDPMTRLTRTDARFRAIFGTTEELTDYLRLFSVMHPDDLPAVEAAVAAALRPDDPEPYAIEYRINRPDGATRWVFAKGRVTYENGESGPHAVRFDGTVLDITDRKRAEETLHDSEARLSGILRRSPAGIVQTDAAGCMTLVNPRWCEMLGYSEGELLGRDVIGITDPSYVEPTAAAIGRLAAGGPDFQIEKSYRRKDGSVLHAQSNIAALRSPDGEFLGLIAVVLDISERFRSEEAMRRLAAELADAGRRKDEFLATLAHELRNPLAPIQNGLQIMRLGGSDVGSLDKIQSMMERQVRQMTHLIDDLMDVARINQGKIVLKKTRVNLADVVRNATDTSRLLIDARGHALTVTLPPSAVYVVGDLTRLSQAVANLLNNAAKFTGDGGHLRLAVERQGSDAVLSVEDNGVGIAAEKQAQIFDMFAQIDHSLEKSQGGLGIGLNIVRQLVELHGGSIAVESEGHGAGSRFVVRLPAAVADAANGPHDRSSVPKDTSVRRRILVVDDNRDAATSLTELLNVMGNDTQTAFDGEQAVAMTEAFCPQVILMDIGMPKVNGYEACRRIRAEPWGKNIVIIAQSGWGQDDVKLKSKQAGFSAHMLKPVDLGALEQLMSGTAAEFR